RPGRVGQIDPVGIDRRGDREHRVAHLAPAEIGARRLERAREVGDQQLLFITGLPVFTGEREAGVGAADVGDQTRHAHPPAGTGSSPNAMPRPRAVRTRASSGSTAWYEATASAIGTSTTWRF